MPKLGCQNNGLCVAQVFEVLVYRLVKLELGRQYHYDFLFAVHH